MYLKILIHPYLIAQNPKESLLNDYITHTLGPDPALKLDSKVREKSLSRSMNSSISMRPHMGQRERAGDNAALGRDVEKIYGSQSHT